MDVIQGLCTSAQAFFLVPDELSESLRSRDRDKTVAGPLRLFNSDPVQTTDLVSVIVFTIKHVTELASRLTPDDRSHIGKK
jgi:hypothetical protein